MLDVLADVSDAQYCLGNTLLLAYIITGEYVARYIILLFQKVILVFSVLVSINLVRIQCYFVT